MPGFEELHLGFLILARASAFMALAPFFTFQGIPGLARAGLGVFLAVLLYPSVEGVTNIPNDLPNYSYLLAREVVVGLIMGYASMLTFNAIRVAGEIMDVQMGFAMAGIFDPQTQTRITPVGHFLYIFAILLFLAINGHHSLILAVTYSYDLIPVGAAIFDTAISVEIARMFVGMFALGFKVAAPFIAVLVISDISMGLVARTVPQLNVFILGFPMKAGLGMLTLSIALPVLAVVIGNVLAHIEGDILTIMEYMAQ